LNIEKAGCKSGFFGLLINVSILKRGHFENKVKNAKIICFPIGKCIIFAKNFIVRNEENF
jgi:hypothetical protein